MVETVTEVSSNKEVVDPGTDRRVVQLGGDPSGRLGKFWFPFFFEEFFFSIRNRFPQEQRRRRRVPQQIATELLD
ncbi:hypothetical protein U1Q18_035776 [Sarracenia purpurea var. burkii]